MPRNPVATYRVLLREARTVLDLPDDATTRSRLYTALKPDRLAAMPTLQAVLDRLGIGAGYARNHLLSLGGWPDDVVACVQQGLPLKVARTLATLEEGERRQVLALADRDRHGTWGQRVGRATDRVRREASAQEVPSDGGWLAPSPTPDASPGPTGDVWRFPTLGPAGREAEELHPDLAHAIVARYARPGDAVVDLTAGSATVALTAREHGCTSWSGDIAPRLPFVHRMDATDVRMTDGLTPGCADLVFLHPPTYFAWLRDRPKASVEGREGYAALIAEMVVNAVPLLREGGHLVLIGRPVRAGGVVHTAIGELQRELEEAGTALVGYHLGVDERGSEDWHVLVGRLGSG